MALSVSAPMALLLSCALGAPWLTLGADGRLVLSLSLVSGASWRVTAVGFRTWSKSSAPNQPRVVVCRPLQSRLHSCLQVALCVLGAHTPVRELFDWEKQWCTRGKTPSSVGLLVWKQRNLCENECVAKRKAGKTKRRTQRETGSLCLKVSGMCRRMWQKCSMKARSRRHGEEDCRLWKTTRRRTSIIGREKTEVRREEEPQERSGTESQVVRRSTAQLRNKQCASIKGCGVQEICNV